MADLRLNAAVISTHDRSAASARGITRRIIPILAIYEVNTENAAVHNPAEAKKT